MVEGHDYTIYSSGPNGRARMYALLALITASVTPLAQRGLLVLLRRFSGDEWDTAQVALFFGGFTALVLYGMLINLFNSYVWRTNVGGLMFRFAGLPAPPQLLGEYLGQVDVRSPHDQTAFQTSYHLTIAQTWEQISMMVMLDSKAGGHVRAHSDMASVRVGMIADVVTLRFTFTFEESVPRRDGGGIVARQFSGAATFEFRKDGAAWVVDGHFFDDIGRSGQVVLRQVIPGTKLANDVKKPGAAPSQSPVEPGATAERRP
jgi:hypothetical protein